MSAASSPPHRVTLTWTGNHFLDEDEIRRLVRDCAGAVAFSFKGSPDAAPLRQALAQRHGVDPGWIAVGAGSSQVLDALFQRFRDHELIDVTPNFHMAATTSRRLGLRYRRVDVREPEELIPALQAVLGESKQLVVLSSPRNPLGYAFSARQIAELLDMAKGPVIVDEAYVEFARNDLVPLLSRTRNLVLVRTFSKAWGLANLRVGYALSPLLDDAFRKEHILPYSVGELAQRVACAVLASPAGVEASLVLAREARERLVLRLGEIVAPTGRVFRSDASFVCIEHPAAPDWAAALATEGIDVTLVKTLRAYPASWPAGLRISVAPRAVEERVLEILGRLRGAR